MTIKYLENIIMNDNYIKKVGTCFSPNDMKVKLLLIPYLFIVTQPTSTLPLHNVSCTFKLCTTK